MSASYNSKLPTHLDWVRFLVGDTDVSQAQVEDEEIRAVLADYGIQYDEDTTGGTWVRYLAAADILQALISRWLAASGGISEKWVSKLRIRYGALESSAENALQGRVDWLRLEGARRRTPKPHVFEIL